jgi:hypothetical protein
VRVGEAIVREERVETEVAGVVGLECRTSASAAGGDKKRTICEEEDANQVVSPCPQ